MIKIKISKKTLRGALDDFLALKFNSWSIHLTSKLLALKTNGPF